MPYIDDCYGGFLECQLEKDHSGLHEFIADGEKNGTRDRKKYKIRWEADGI